MYTKIDSILNSCLVFVSICLLRKIFHTFCNKPKLISLIHCKKNMAQMVLSGSFVVEVERKLQENCEHAYIES